jgi:hypothetical protein
MGICEVIAADHDEVTSLFDQLEPLAGDDARAAQAMRVAARLAIAVKTHALAEQRVLYEALRTAGDRLAACALEGPHEVHAVEVILDKLLTLRPGRELRAAVAVARRLFAQHAQHERDELLPALTAELPEDQRAQLGRDVLHEKQRVRPVVARQIAPVVVTRPTLV